MNAMVKRRGKRDDSGEQQEARAKVTDAIVVVIVVAVATEVTMIIS